MLVDANIVSVAQIMRMGAKSQLKIREPAVRSQEFRAIKRGITGWSKPLAGVVGWFFAPAATHMAVSLWLIVELAKIFP